MTEQKLCNMLVKCVKNEIIKQNICSQLQVTGCCNFGQQNCKKHISGKKIFYKIKIKNKQQVWLINYIYSLPNFRGECGCVKWKSRIKISLLEKLSDVAGVLMVSSPYQLSADEA